MDLTGSLINFENIVLFLIPGFLAWCFFSWLTPMKKRSDLEITIISVLISAVLSYLSPKIFYLLTSLQGINYCFVTLFPSQILIPLISIFLGGVFAWILSRILKIEIFLTFLGKFFGVEYRPFTRVWTSFFNRVKANDMVKIITTQDINYIGVVRSYSIDLNEDLQEVELWNPIYFDRNTASVVLIKETDSVLLNSRVILSIEKINKEAIKKLLPRRR